MFDEKVCQVRNCYNKVAVEYARLFFNELDKKPFDRSILERFSNLVKDDGKVYDIGCGPGEVAYFLSAFGVNVSGIDISEEMVKEARKLSPHIEFQMGDMFNLKIPNDSAIGISAFYTIVNFEINKVEKAFMEFFRVLKSGGYLLISFHIGSKKIQLDEFFGEKMEIDFVYFETDEIIEILKKVGFEIEEVIIRYPYKNVEHQSKRAYITAKKIL